MGGVVSPQGPGVPTPTSPALSGSPDGMTRFSQAGTIINEPSPRSPSVPASSSKAGKPPPPQLREGAREEFERQRAREEAEASRPRPKSPVLPKTHNPPPKAGPVERAPQEVQDFARHIVNDKAYLPIFFVHPEHLYLQEGADQRGHCIVAARIHGG